MAHPDIRIDESNRHQMPVLLRTRNVMSIRTMSDLMIGYSHHPSSTTLFTLSTPGSNPVSCVAKPGLIHVACVVRVAR
jgi:hypothetical protein